MRVRKRFKLAISVFTLLTMQLVTNAQKTLLRKDVLKQNERNEKPDFGPNGNWYLTNVMGFSMTLPINESDSLGIRNSASSNQLYYGVRYKGKINEYFSAGFDMFYMRQGFRIKQDSARNLLSLGHENNKQRLAFHNIGVSAFARINFDKRGNYLGKYIDFAGELQYVVGERLFTKNHADPALNNGASMIRTNASKLDYTRNIQQYGVVRFGWSHVVLSARYRISDLFNASQNIHAGIKLPELPRLSIGIEILLPHESSYEDVPEDLEEIE